MSAKKKQYLWLPYLDKINLSNKTVYFKYKNGEEKLEWKDIHSLMLYGQTTDLPQEFLEKCAFYRIPVIIHRRNMLRAVLITPTLTCDQENILTKQIIYRENHKKKNYIGKKLLQAKFKSMSWLIPLKRDLLYRITNIEKMLNIEAWHAKKYWQDFYKKLKIKSRRRDGDRDIAEKCLNAVSKFISGIILRWVLYHSLSPYHGFLHKPTNYPSLVYDLMEPYRGYFDKVVFETIKKAKKEKLKDDSKYIAYTIENIKTFLDSKIYVEATRQVVSFQELLHGIVLAFRSYLLGNSRRFIVPMPSKPNGGRPVKAGYQLYGHKAGITNFWPETRAISQKFEEFFYKN